MEKTNVIGPCVTKEGLLEIANMMRDDELLENFDISKLNIITPQPANDTLETIKNCKARDELPFGMDIDTYTMYQEDSVNMFDTGDFSKDTIEMDCQFLNYVDDTINALRDNIKAFIDTKNLRTEVEIARVVKK